MKEILIDTRGLGCPLPLLKIRKSLRGEPSGTRVIILATDPGTEGDLKDYCRAAGFAYLHGDMDGGVFQAVIETC